MIRKILLTALIAASSGSAFSAIVSGKVTTNSGSPIANVAVTDGDTIVVTDSNGRYSMDTDKRNGYVWYTVPKGYKPITDGVFPQIHQRLTLPAESNETKDFTVIPDPGQDNYKIVFFGDMHLARLRKDIKQFREVMADFVKWRDSFPDTPVYAITLGDMTWDKHWYTRNMKLEDYAKEINRDIKGVTIYHTIGNHDNDMRALNNTSAKQPFHNIVAPNYYSFNIGDVHYVILDDIDCSGYDGTEARKYSVNLVQEQLKWLRQDLALVAPETPVFIMSHAPVFFPDGVNKFKKWIKNTDELLDVVGNHTVHFVTGHTHKNFNVMPQHSVTNGHNVYEHNVAAVCSDWWFSGALTPGCLVAQDGTPSGFAVWDVNGTNLRNTYRPFFSGETLQFRAYDLNNVAFSLDDVPNLKNEEVRAAFQKYCDPYPANSDNKVLINVWNYNPEWQISVVTEKSDTLSTRQVMAFDPLHLAASTVKRYNKPLKKVPSLTTNLYPHFFMVQCPDADTDLTITVTDPYGRKYTQTMHRPMPFSTDAYATK